ncbi:MocR-like pyridoxine biosynthesis transcription factor PdxR [Paenibacillus macerans]|uniref:Aminotransferase class I and II family protein n=1 Tax=Paenibacillus macerans TaxID=44252 RepID=A0A090ZJH9_PAEMA|nr:PLP-dependent aminotransferase family protein [Paenibacillus macerans]KFN11494.1 aminotransferase class I and II family protein [Paenibacillus macerans]MCY7558940.1 PLP-dependent aminotransferase family protein [Paenibacillus macerans]MEC0149432.1 PLP-dependent aminotransferase family protein [Paenibacillus macerans]SUA86154.1 GntR family transcriptional regulator with aminotransferase domain [Paenibacillus macerans]
MWGIELQKDGEMPLKRQLYMALSERILNGAIKAGEALPSTRGLAQQLKISRNTVVEAYDMLAVEGFILNRPGSVARVAGGLVLEPLTPPAESSREVRPAPVPLLADFRTGHPDLRLFPRYLWQQLSKRTLQEMPYDLLGYTGPQGLPRLREEIAAHLLRSKGLYAAPEDIFITAGATHALNLVTDLLYEEGKPICMEDPCNRGMLQILLNKGYAVNPIPVDKLGVQTEYLQGQPSCAVYVTPSHQFPLGGVLPASRRTALIRYARKKNCYIVEDDYDSEFRYYGDPVAPLYAMDPERVIHIGTFSKVLVPALRIGYVILPGKLHQRWRQLRTHSDVQNPPFEQAVLAEFLHRRKFDRHIRTATKQYGERRQTLLASLKAHFGDIWHAWGDASGLHLAVQFPGMEFDEAFAKNCINHGVRVTPVEYHCIHKGKHADKLLFGYGHMEPEDIEKGVALFHEIVMRFQRE